MLSNRSSDQGGGLYVTNSNATVVTNTLLGNQSGAGLGGVYIKNYPVFTGNNLYGNASYDLVNGNLAGAGDLKAEFNWWGTIELPEILSHIWDYLDDSTLSLVDFDPAWAYPQLGAPISLPTGLQVLRSGNSLELSWNENPESDTAGYKIYYDTDGPGFPYSGTGLLQGDAPIDVGEALNYTLTSVPDGVYHFGLTAYDSDRDGQDDQTEGNESWFSDDVMVTVGQIPEAGFSAAPTIRGAATRGATLPINPAAILRPAVGTSATAAAAIHAAIPVTLTRRSEASPLPSRSADPPVRTARSSLATSP